MADPETSAAEPEQPEAEEPESVTFVTLKDVNEVSVNLGPVEETIVVKGKGYSTDDPYVIAALDQTEGVKRQGKKGS